MLLNLSRCLWVIFHLNLKTLFWRYMPSLYFPSLDSPKYRFSQGTINKICSFGGWPQNYLTRLEALRISMGVFRSLYYLHVTSKLHCFRLAVQFSRDICSRTYSIVLPRCLWSLILTFAMFMKLLLMIGCIRSIEVE